MRVAWFSYFPVEWLPDGPEFLRSLPKQHPATWQRVLLSELQEVPGLELHVLVLRRNFERNCSFQYHGVTFHLIKTIPGWRTLSLFWLDTLLIKRKLEQIKPDVVHAWGTEYAAALIATRLNYPYVVTMQGLLTWCRKRIYLNRYQTVMSYLEDIALRRVKLVTTESSFSAQYLRNRYPNLNVRQAEHAPNWLFHQIKRQPRLQPVHLLFVGAIAPTKGADLLLRAVHELRMEHPVQLTLVGSGSPEFIASLEASVAPEVWRRVQIKSQLTSEDVAQEMLSATLMVFPTRADTSPNAVKEAAVAGLPVIASRIGGIPDYVYPDKNGLLFAPGGLQELISSLRQALNHPLLGKGIVDIECLARVREHLSPAVMRRNFLEAYEAAKTLGAKS